MRVTMRRFVDVVCVLFVVATVAGIMYFNSEEARQRRAVAGVATQLQRFREAIDYHAASGQDNNPRGWPNTIDPKWFGNDPPRNTLVSPERPWVEVATPEEAALKDPENRMTLSPLLGSFWYNPYQGVIRARVPLEINDEKALAMYNAINGTHLDSLYGPGPTPIAPPTSDDAQDGTKSASAEPAKEPAGRGASPRPRR